MGVLDKEKGTLRYCEVAGGEVLRMQLQHKENVQVLQGTPLQAGRPGPHCSTACVRDPVMHAAH